MSYDNWKTSPPDTDECTEDATTCECPECRSWRENREPSDAEIEARAEAATFASHEQAALVRLKR